MFGCINKFLANKGSTFYLEENKKNKNILIYVLCGYKKYLYSIIFERFSKYLDIDADVCLVTSGKFDQETFEIAKKNNWCYLSSKKNNISIAQNAAILNFEKAEVIIKLDEDIFLTEHVLSDLVNKYKDVKNKKIRFSFISPLININGYTSKRILEILKFQDAISRFPTLKYKYGGKNNLPESNLDFVKFMWNYENQFMSIDKMNALVKKNNNEYEKCPIWFSIGILLFERKFWKKIGEFSTHPFINDLGTDEVKINIISDIFRLKRIISLNSVVGHYSFKGTNKMMNELFKINSDFLKID